MRGLLIAVVTALLVPSGASAAPSLTGERAHKEAVRWARGDVAGGYALSFERPRCRRIDSRRVLCRVRQHGVNFGLDGEGFPYTFYLRISRMPNSGCVRVVVEGTLERQVC